MRNAVIFFVSALLLLAAGSAWLALYPSVPADLGGVESLDAQASRVRIPIGDRDHVDGWYLRGTRPATVILFAGYARDHRRMWRYAQFLRQDGYHVLAVDFRSARSMNRKPTTLGYWELRDARAALDWIRARPESRGHRIAFMGESLGGDVALALAAERSDVSAVVADCPFASADEAIADGFRLVLHLPAFPLATIARQLGRLVTGHDPGEMDATAALRSLNGRPVLLIQTRAGDRFSRGQVDRLTTSAGLGTDTWTVEDARHTEIWVTHREEYEKRVRRFLAPRLGGDSGESGDARADRAVQGERTGGHAVVEGTRTTGNPVSEGVKAAGRVPAQPLKKKKSGT